MPTIHSYADANDFLHTRGKAVPRKKYANNTYLHRTTDHGVDFIHLRLHNTDVVTWSMDGLLILNTGGWLTVTTKARINDVLPFGWHLVSIKGTWHLADGWRHSTNSYRFRDGIQMRRNSITGDWSVVVDTAQPEPQAEKDDRHNAAMRKLIAKYVKGYGDTLETDYSEPGQADACTLCRVARTEAHPTSGIDRPRWITYGDEMGDTQHLTDHMLDGVLPYTLVLAALAEKGYLPHHSHGADTVKRCLRAYLSSRLFVGATAPVHGRRPITSGV